MSERTFGEGTFGEGEFGGAPLGIDPEPGDDGEGTPSPATVIRFQPTLPAPDDPTTAEKDFIRTQPNFFPANQDSNWGTLRRSFTDSIQELIDQQTMIWKERFVSRSSDFLDEWEFQMGLPEAPTGDSIDVRRLKVLSRLRTGPFTDERRIPLIEPYLTATFGVSTELTPSGVSLVGGIPLFADAAGDPKQFYRIYEDVRNFNYEVWIVSSMTPDIASLSRDLEAITPAGITIVIDNAHANILDYVREMKNGQPAGWWRVGATDGADSSGNGLGGTWNGSPATVASPGLLHASVAGSNGAMTLDGADDYLVIASDPRLHTPRISLEAWYKPNALPTSGQMDIILAESANDFIGIDGTTGKFVAAVSVGGTRYTVYGPTAVVGTTYHIVGKHTGAEIELTVNNVKFSAAAGGMRDIGNTSIYVGRAQGGGSFAAGVVDEPAIYDRKVKDEEITMRYNTGRNVLL